MKEYWDKFKQLMKDMWEYLRGLKTILFLAGTAAVGAIQEIGVDKLVPEDHVGKAFIGIAVVGALLRYVTKGPIKGMD